MSSVSSPVFVILQERHNIVSQLSCLFPEERASLCRLESKENHKEEVMEGRARLEEMLSVLYTTCSEKLTACKALRSNNLKKDAYRCRASKKAIEGYAHDLRSVGYSKSADKASMDCKNFVLKQTREYSEMVDFLTIKYLSVLEIEAELQAKMNQVGTCFLCQKEFPKKIDMSMEMVVPHCSFCSECRCYVCSECDCQIYHLSHQDQLWTSIEQQENTETKTKKKKRKKKKRPRNRKQRSIQNDDDDDDEREETTMVPTNGLPTMATNKTIQHPPSSGKENKKPEDYGSEDSTNPKELIEPPQELVPKASLVVQSYPFRLAPTSDGTTKNGDNDVEVASDHDDLSEGIGASTERKIVDEESTSGINFVEYLHVTGSILALAKLMDELESRGIDLDSHEDESDFWVARKRKTMGVFHKEMK